jgi:pyruvate,water dikinase
MTLDIFYPLETIHPSDRWIVGDKAFYLSLLAQRGCPVVPGLVVSAQVFRDFLEDVHWQEPLFSDFPNSSLHLDVDDPHQLQEIAQHLRHTIQSSALREDWLSELETRVQIWQIPTVILRPSLSFSNSFDSSLNQKAGGMFGSEVCQISKAAIAQALKRVWSTLFQAKSLLYWQRLGVQLQQINLAVLIQPIQSAIASGDLEIQATEFNIRATPGLGMAIGEGKVFPDWYSIHPETGHLQDYRPGTKIFSYQVATVPNAFTADLQPTSLLTQITPEDRVLQAHLLDQSQQQQHALTDLQIQQLVQIAQNAFQILESSLYLEWTIPAIAPDQTPTSYITEVSPLFTKSGAVWRAKPEVQPTSPPPSTKTLPTADLHQSELEPLSNILVGIAGASGQTLAEAWVIADEPQTLPQIPTGKVLVMSNLLPEQVSWIAGAVGVVTRQGGATSHGAIVARELGIPAVVGIGSAIEQIQTGDVLLVDGDRGMVYRLHHLSTETALTPSIEQQPSLSTEAVAQDRPEIAMQLPARPNATQLLVNLSYPNALSEIAALPIDGVGLLRAEQLLMHVFQHQHPTRWLERRQELVDQLVHQILQFARAFAPRPVFYRTLDVRSQDISLPGTEEMLPEPNPTLGLHGTLSYQTNPSLFDLELTALRQIQQLGYSNVHLLLPFVRTVEEFQFCQHRIVQLGLRSDPSFQVWIMAEVPSILFLLPDYVKAGVQGVSIGSNDLTQLILAVDRDQPQMKAAFNQCHLAVLRAMQHLIQTARQEGIPCSICGQAPAQHPELVEQLVRWGISAISVSPDAIAQTYRAIARAEQSLVLEAIRSTLDRG